MANKKEDYLFLSAMLRARESKMLKRSKAEAMLDASSFGEAARMVADCGYKDMSAMNAKEIEQALNEHRAEEFAELGRMAPNESVVDLFRTKYDYHNVKTLLKAEAENVDRSDLLNDSGRIPVEKLTEAIHEDQLVGVPSILGDAIREAKTVLARTGNPQLADFILDRAYFEELDGFSKELNSEFLKGYVQVMIDSANLRSAVRTLRMHKDADFLKTAFVPGGNVDQARLLNVTFSGNGEGLAQLFNTGTLTKAASLGAAAAAGGTMTEFERACDDAVTAYLKKSGLVAYDEEPVITYLAELEGEITTIRMILTGRLAGIEPQVIKERLRDLYA